MVLSYGLIPLVAAAMLSVSCPPLSGQEAADASWLEGCWLQRGERGQTEEIWTSSLGGIMVGMSRVVRDDQPASWEFLLLRTIDGRLTYSAYPAGQEPADFVNMAGTEGFLRFENRSHDFPQAIEYWREGTNLIQARVFGSYQDAEPAFVLSYERAGCPGSSEPVRG